IGTALLHHRPVGGVESGVDDSGELQEGMMCGELTEERKAIAAAEFESRQCNGLQGQFRGDSIEPRQRRMTERSYMSAVPPEGTNIDREGDARAAGPSAHRHLQWSVESLRFATLESGKSH